jgi:hypothetical protein
MFYLTPKLQKNFNFNINFRYNHEYHGVRPCIQNVAYAVGKPLQASHVESDLYLQQLIHLKNDALKKLFVGALV